MLFSELNNIDARIFQKTIHIPLENVHAGNDKLENRSNLARGSGSGCSLISIATSVILNLLLCTLLSFHNA